MSKRPDIQVARAIAVLAVLGFHIGVPGFFNGFLGVDAFFVITGFLMGTLYRDIKALDFYKRRFLRLYPSLIVTIVMFVIAGLFVLQSFELEQLTSQALAGLLGISNIAYWSQDSYFQPDRFRPFLNLWSLGVEIQFYLIFPFLLYLSNKKYVLPFLAIVSFTFNYLLLQISPKTSFFMLPSRLWEFLIGMMIVNYQFSGISYRKKRIAIFISVVFFLLAFVIPVKSSSTDWLTGHPGLNAFVIVVTTSVLLKLRINEKRFESWLGKLSVKLGNLSYEVYLIHFPLLAFINYQAFSGTVTKVSQVVSAISILIVIWALSLITININSIKLFGNPKLVLSVSLGISLLLLLAPLPRLALAGSSEISRVTSFAISDRSQYRCGKIFRVLHPSSELCLISSEFKAGRDNLLLFGDSRADMIKNEVKKIVGSRANVYFWVQNSPFLLQTEEILKIMNRYQISKVIIHTSSTKPTAELVELLNQAKDVDFVMLGAVPTYSINLPKLVHQKLSAGELNFSNLDLSSYLVPDSLLVDKKYQAVESANFKYISSFDYLCDESGCTWHNGQNKLYYFDSNHLTLTGARALKIPISRSLNQLLES
jgi:peptidoglycan/LPS O-acetylase OafA/YrhL